MKSKFRIIIDFIMTVVLLCLMAYQIVGQELHEWLGTFMLVLFIIHSVLNIRWYGSLFKGKYRALRIFQTLVNLAVLGSILCLGYSGIILSRYVFDPFSIDGPMATARSMHMAASYWGFVLMSIHLGLHWGMVMGGFRKIIRGRKLSKVFSWILRLIAAAFAVYGLSCFIKRDIFYYMFLKYHFVFFDYTMSAAEVFMEYTAMMGFWVFAGYYMAKILKRPIKRL